MKKIMILGGGSQHCKLVEAAKEMGLYTIVCDYLEDAPAKRMADRHYLINVTETEALARVCEEEKVDGIVSGWFDFIQPHYQRLCERVGLPCYGAYDDFMVLTHKDLFKAACKKYGVGTIPSYEYVEGVTKPSDIRLPVFVKPVDSRGSRGMTVCRSFEEISAAYKYAQSQSFSGNATVEQYMEGYPQFVLSLFFIDGKYYLEQIGDAYFGDPAVGLDRINVAYHLPSRRWDKNAKDAIDRLANMCLELGVRNGPICMQGFFAEDDLYFYDPGRRFCGGEYERAMTPALGVDMMKRMIEFALTGKFSDTYGALTEDMYMLNGKKCIRLQLNVRPGTITAVSGVEEIKRDPNVIYVAEYHELGTKIEYTGSTKHRYAHVVILADSNEELKRSVDYVHNTLKVLDENGENMLVSLFDTDKLLAPAEAL